MPGGVIDWLIAPRSTCMGCGSKLGTDVNWLCAECAGSLRPLSEDDKARVKICLDCGREIRERACPNCGIGHRQLTAVAAYEYGGPVRRVVENYKFRSVYRMDAWMAGELDKALTACGVTEYDVATAVPLHKSRMLVRGYNQSERLARKLCALTGKPYAELLRRTRATRQQARLTADKRRTNIKNAFAAPHPLAGEKVLLIDDVRTTGATLTECAGVLLNAGAAEVIVATFARA